MLLLSAVGGKPPFPLTSRDLLPEDESPALCASHSGRGPLWGAYGTCSQGGDVPGPGGADLAPRAGQLSVSHLVRSPSDTALLVGVAPLLAGL